MKRRQFIRKTSAGLIMTAGFGHWSIRNNFSPLLQYDFKPYRPGKTLGDVYQVTPQDGYYANTYYDIVPWSPSQQYMAVTKLPYQDKITTLGDIAEVCIIDLKNRTIRTVYKTKVWGYQLGANLHWGSTDRYLYTNDIIEGDHAVTVRIDLETGETNAYEGPMYDLAAEQQNVIGPTLEYLNTTQYAYTTPAPRADPAAFMRLPVGAADDEGLWKTDLQSNQNRLLVSLASAAASLEEHEYYQGGTFYFFHTKYNPQADKIMLVVRCTFPDLEKYEYKDSRNPSLLTTDADGNKIKVVVSRQQWQAGGHHPTWHPDGEHIIMNLTPEWLGEDQLRFCQFKADGSDFKILSKKIIGGGHPSITPDSRYLLSDAYPFEPQALGNGEIPIRLIDLQAQKEHSICTVFTDLGQKYEVRRFWGPSKLDAHPVWDRKYQQVCFNGAPEGKRAVLVGDLSTFFS